MTSDPIADMLTRVRNAIQARHPKVDVPASKLKAEIARILKEEGYIANFKVAEEGVKKTIKIYLKYGADNSPVISAIERVSRPGLPRVRRPDGYSARAGRPGHQHLDHRARRDDRARRPQGARGRRDPVPGLVVRNVMESLRSRRRGGTQRRAGTRVFLRVSAPPRRQR